MQAGSAVVLFVDDVDAIVEELLTLMMLHGIRSVGATDLDQAIKVLERETEVRVLCCDLRLAHESGLEIVGRVAKHPVLRIRNLQYLFVTGDKSIADTSSLVVEHQVLSKPVDPGMLVDKLKSMLGVRGVV